MTSSERMVVTGGLGFIGSAFIRSMAPQISEIVNIDAQTYAGDSSRIEGLGNVRTYRLDIATDDLTGLVRDTAPRVMVHFAAETHVTRSEIDERTFFRTNVDGTEAALQAAADAGVDLFVHVSTDEVYGPALDHPFREDEKLPGEGRATSAYARSKALADDLAMSYGDELTVVVVRPTNCFGPWQHPEKAIARWTTRALSGLRLPVWGDGLYVRDWMFVDDVADAIETIIRSQPPSGVYNIGPGGEPIANVEIAGSIARAAGCEEDTVYLTDYDRPQHDRRYSVDSMKIGSLGWRSETEIRTALESTVGWYRDNRSWWEPLTDIAESLYSDEEER